MHERPGASGAREHWSLCIEKVSAATILVNVIESVLDLFETVMVSGALAAVATTGPKSCLSGLSFSSAPESAVAAA